MSFTDSRGRVWPLESIVRYQREEEFWRDYASTLQSLARCYREGGNETSAERTENDAKDILRALDYDTHTEVQHGH